MSKLLRFKFVMEGAIVYGLEIEMDGRVTQAKVEEKEEALNKYDDAIASGNAGIIMNRGINRDSFDISVGNLQPHKDCIIGIKYINLLEAEGDSVFCSIPLARTHLFVRYMMLNAENNPCQIT
jgi:hypothetical protein